MAKAEEYQFDFKAIYESLDPLIDSGIQYYTDKDGDVDSKFFKLFERAKRVLELVRPLEENLAKVVDVFDFVYPDGEQVKGSGFRSLLYVYHSALASFQHVFEHWSKRHGGWLYVATEHLDNMRAHVRVLDGVRLLLKYAVVLAEQRVGEGTVFSDGEIATVLKKLAISDEAERDCFYGRCLGFQYTSSYLRPVLQALAIAMASYDSWYQLPRNSGKVVKLLASAINGSDYVMFPNRRGMKFADLTQDCNVHFTKAFWSINEDPNIRSLVNIVSPRPSVRIELMVPTDDITLQAPTQCSKSFTLPVPSSGGQPPAAIHCLLLSYHVRKGDGGRKARPLSTGLLVHLHGGGFVAQSSLSHEFYLHSWAKELDVPIFSIDYSLAPEAPFPRGIDDCVFAYAWALNNLETLGTTGERIVVAGDSAGGNMLITMTLKLQELGIRPPDLLVPVYPTTLVKIEISPSRLLSVMDPVLPIGVLISCLNAYTNNVPSKSVMEKRRGVRDEILLAKGRVPFSSIRERSPSLVHHHRRKTTPDNDTSPIIASRHTDNVDDKVEELIAKVIDAYDDLEVSSDPLVSPYLASDDVLRRLPPVSVVVAGLDPLMDDGIEFAKKLVKLDNQVTLDVVPNLPHGFLCLAGHPDTKETINMVLSRIKAGLEAPPPNNAEATSDTTKPPVTMEYKITSV